MHNPTLKHYIDLLTETSFLTWTWNTMLVAVVSTAISLILGVMLAYPLARMRFAGAGLIAMTVAAIYLVPQPLLFIPLADLINRLDLGNTLTAVILTYPTMLVPFCAWLLLGYFKTVPMELEEAARIDGASRLQTMRQIFLPLCVPGFISAGIFAFTLSQNEFLYALIFLTKSAVRTVPVGVIAELIRGDVFYWGQLMAGALLGFDPSGDHLFVLCRALCRRPDFGLGQGVALGARRRLDIVRTIADLRSHIAGWRQAGERSASCRRWARCTRVIWHWSERRRPNVERAVATIFVNPKQFGPNEDLGSYPRREAADLAMLRSAGVDLVFMPATAEIYPPGFATTVRVAGLTDCLCGAHRPGHFDGVATVVTKLLLQSLPDVALFRREGLSAIARCPPAGPRPRHPGAHRGRADRARSRRARTVVAQRLPVAGGAPDRPQSRSGIAADRGGVGSATGDSRE